MTIERWNPTEFSRKIGEHADREFSPEDGAEKASWLDAVQKLLEKAHERGDGVAVYENADLGHPEIGQWQVASYGSEASQLETRSTTYFESTAEQLNLFRDGDDFLPKTLPDIGGRINWRYTLKAVCPSVEGQ